MCLIGDKLITDPNEDEVSISDFYFSNIKFSNEESKTNFLNILVMMYKIQGESINSDILFNSFNIE